MTVTVRVTVTATNHAREVGRYTLNPILLQHQLPTV